MKKRRMSEEEFKALVKNLVPTCLEPAKWMCDEIENVTDENPELREKILKWCKGVDLKWEKRK